MAKKKAKKKPPKKKVAKKPAVNKTKGKAEISKLSPELQISDSDIDKVLWLARKDSKRVYFSLGVGLQYQYAPPGVSYCAPYYRMGKDLWRALEKEVYALICDRSTRAPKEWVQDLISGDIRNLAVGIVTAIASTYTIGLGIAVPAAALVMKKGVAAYCRKRPTKSTGVSAKDILRRKKIGMKKASKEIQRLTEQDQKESR